MPKFLMTSLGRYVAKTKESVFGTKQTAGFDKTIIQSGDQIVITPRNLDNTGLTGKQEPIEQDRLTADGSGAHNQKLLPQHMRFIAAAMGSCVNSDLTDAHSHECKPASNVELPSFTIVEDYGTMGSGEVQYSYPGCVVDSFTISGQANEACLFNARILTCGKREATSVSEPDVLAESYLRIGDLELYEGGTIVDAQTVPTGATEYSSSLISFSYTYSNSAKMELGAGNQTGYAAEALRTAIGHTLSMRVYMEDATWLEKLDSNSYQTLYIPILGDQIGSTGHYFGFKLIFPKVKLLTSSPVEHEGATAVDLTFQVLDPDGEYDTEGVTNSVHITSYDEQTTYLSA